ncbi:MAG: nicotinate-nucleotide adenylyltransferase [Candidatus Cloacimonadales bacterium]|nr:nicotinate-nucleotide adenylyltransferase [Candidatus Cloacimonadales bacterium]
MKIGLLGGSFDPLHNGHLALAETAAKALELDKVLFLPSGNHPLKKEKNVLPAEKRFELVEKALQNYPNFEVSRLDMEQEGFSYSSELIKRLKDISPENDFFFITGDDIIAELPNWHEWEWLLQNVQFVVARRPDTDRDKWQHLDYLEYFIFIDMKPHDISSTEIRKKVKNKESIKGLVPESIEQEIKDLYR